MPFLVPCSDLRSLAAFSSDRWYFSPIRWSDPKPDPFRVCARPSSGVALGLDKRKDPRWSICTADELHYVSVPNSDWNLALWRYLPSPKVLSFSLSMFINVYCEFLGNNGDRSMHRRSRRIIRCYCCQGSPQMQLDSISLPR